MTNWTRFSVAALTVALMSLTAHASARRPAELWAFFHFDGKNFAAGKPVDRTPFVAVRDGFIPVVHTREEKIVAVQLAPGTGAVAGICYVQSFGGKLKPAAGYHPVPLLAVQISTSENVVITMETDNNGFFVATLPEGSYRLGNQGVEVKVESGTTKLIPLRVGKRMVD